MTTSRGSVRACGESTYDHVSLEPAKQQGLHSDRREEEPDHRQTTLAEFWQQLQEELRSRKQVESGCGEDPLDGLAEDVLV